MAKSQRLRHPSGSASVNDISEKMATKSQTLVCDSASYREDAVVAMDFGTMYSGYAFSFKGQYQKDPSRIYCNNAWTTGTHVLASMKTPTAILLKWDKKKRDFEKVDFGYNAQRRYAEMEKAERAHHVIADRFKMELYSESASAGLRRDFKLKLGNRKKILAMRLISMFIEYLKDHFLKLLRDRGEQLEVSNIRWVLTVPAIWTDGAKQFMREAAEMVDIGPAGIPSFGLTIVFEPEAAASHCLHLLDPTTRQMMPFLREGAKYLLIDAGGGTVDFTVLEVTGPQSMEVKHRPSGGPWGGMVVDENFRDTIRRIIGRETLDEFARDHRDDHFELFLNFEGLKRRKLGDEEKIVGMNIPVNLAELYKKNTGKSLQSAARARYNDKVKVLEKIKLKLAREIFSDLFKGPCERIVEHTKDLLREIGPIEAILLVGGFGSSDVVQRSIRENFKNCRVVIPEEPELAVVKGAVHYGNNPQVVKSRIVAYTYGTDTCKKFVKGSHPICKRAVYDGKEKCTDIFHVHVHKGQAVKLGHVESRTSYSPVDPDQRFMKFQIFASTEIHPKYVTDASCKLIGEFSIDLPGCGLDRKVIAEMSFGETELVIRATEQKSRKSVSTRLNFLDIDALRCQGPLSGFKRLKLADNDDCD